MTIIASPPAEFPSAWACACGQDDYGFWQAIELSGVQQIMRWIPAGEFLMGSPDNEAERGNNENLHHVVLSEGFWLADTACTQQLWVAVMADNPSDFSDNPENPVETVNWLNCQQFFTKVNNSLMNDLQLRFPTEAEWEYACRAGTRTAFSWGDELTTEQANYKGTSPYAGGKKGEYREGTVSVTAFLPNSWGLYQMHGNVWEWCADRYIGHLTDNAVDPAGPVEGGRRVLRGGGWRYDGRILRSARRCANQPDDRFHFIGFRLAGG
jgi:formylglycine-generating enzyme required for sulfatase activity